MGVPKFYRWVSERYPCLSETVKEFQIPEFDNLYLDMNGIIHVCSHPDDGNPHFRITEEKIFSDIFHYLEFLFRIIKPQKVFFMAVDGVAPRAKMNQQRGRRFRSAREAEELEKKARESGETLPTEKRFDSNCITPGTPFMVRLQEQLKYFVVSKQSCDPLWQDVEVHLSGHETPGEGEHKIMDYIRYVRSQPNYDPNTRHCLYGLDADLMMLGLATHEPHFSLLREEVRFGGHKDKNKRPATPEETTFHLLHLSLFREYLDFEFSPLKTMNLEFPYDLERIIDDWVLMGFLVGNDFIPHLPHLHIQHDALPLLWKTYMKVLPACGGYLHDGGKLNLDRFEKFMEALAEFDVEKFSDTYTDLKWLEGKIGGKAINEEAAQAAEEKSTKKLLKLSNQFGALMEDVEDIGNDFVPKSSSLTSFDVDDDEEEEEGDTFDEEFRQHKKYYYMSKMEYEKVTNEVLQDQAECYVRGIQWILLYYYHGVPSWSWFYPHHYAPYISDVKNFRHMQIKFELSKPFLPFQQLMAVLPSLSKELLPEPYQSLMTMDTSPVIDFYPINFQTDLNGKQQDWEAVVLIPFIEEKRLLAAMDEVERQLTAEERGRNKHGPSYCFNYEAELLEPFPSTLSGVFPDVAANHSRMSLIDMNKFRIPADDMIQGLLDKVLMDVYFPGFPTLKHLPHKARLKKEGVKVFQMNSRSENMILQILPPETEPSLDSAADDLLGKAVFVNWPHLYEAKVLSVSDRETRYVYREQGAKSGKPGKVQILTEYLNEQDGDIWGREVQAIKERYHDRLGIDVGDTHILVKAIPMIGRKYICGSHGKITLEKEFATLPVPFLLQATVKDITTHDSSFCQFKTLTELFPAKETVFMLGWPHYGCQGEVVDTDEGQSPRVRINVLIPSEPDLYSVENEQQSHEQRFYAGHEVARMCGISSHFLSRITGSIMVRKGSPEKPVENSGMINIGLNLKFTKRNEETPGYTKLSKEGGWGYSMKTKEVVCSYLQQFPNIWDAICSKSSDHNDLFFESELFPENGETSAKTMQEFVKSLPCGSVKTMKAGADILDEGVVSAIENEVQSLAEENRRRQKRVKMQVKPHLLYRALTGQGNMVPDPTVTFQLYDRVVNVRQGFPVPFGLRGTVIGIHIAEKEMDIMYDVLFDEEFQGGIKMRCLTYRAYRMPKSSMLNLSHGERKNTMKSKPSNQQPGDNRYQSHQNRQGSGSYSGMSYASASQGFTGAYSNRSDNRYNNYNDNRYEGRRITKGDKQHQNAWTEQRQEGRNDNRQLWLNNRTEKRHFTQDNKQQDSTKLDVNSHSFDEGRNAASPKFVMPKVSNKTTPKQGVKGQPTKGNVELQNAEFANMWKELQSSGNVTSDKTVTSGDSDTKPANKGTSLRAAAAALDKLPKPTGLLPTPVINSTDNKPEQKLTVENLFDQANKAQLTAESEQFTAMVKSLELSQDKTEDGAIVITSKAKSPKAEVQEGTAALKHMLHIGSPDQIENVQKEQETMTAAPPSGRTYGRQLSVQELFDGAKQPQAKPDQKPLPQHQDHVPGLHQNQQKTSVPPGHPHLPVHQPQHQPHPALLPYPPPLQLAPLATFNQGPPPGNYRHQKPRYPNQQQGFMGHQVRGHQPQQVRGHQQMVQPPVHGKFGGRNPVMELLEWCKAMKQAEPRYDFFGKQGAMSCVVTLSSGVRFQGSTTRTKEESAESAAAIALLNMGIQPHPRMPPMGFPAVPQVIVPPPQISSPNSAFKPVSPKDYFPQQPNYRQPPQTQGVPGGYPGNNLQRGQYDQSASQDKYHRQGSNQHQENRHGGYQGKQGYNQSGKKQQHHSTNQRTNDIDNANSDNVQAKHKSKANPFVPMQVTRQQRTPGKRKESESLSDGDHKNGVDSTEVSPKSESDEIGKPHPSSSIARDLFGQEQNLKAEKLPHVKTEMLVDLSEPTCQTTLLNQTTPPKQKSATTPGHAGKRRSRMAANLNFGGTS